MNVLDSQEGKVMFFFYFMYLLLMKFAFKISPVVLFGLTYVYKGCLGYLSIACLHFLIQVNSYDIAPKLNAYLFIEHS